VRNPAWDKTVQECIQVENMGAIKIQKCGHEFSAVPLLYEVMTKVFKCPICRGGSETEVTLDEDKFRPTCLQKLGKSCVEIPQESEMRIKDKDRLKRTHFHWECR